MLDFKGFLEGWIVGLEPTYVLPMFRYLRGFAGLVTKFGDKFVNPTALIIQHKGGQVKTPF